MLVSFEEMLDCSRQDVVELLVRGALTVQRREKGGWELAFQATYQPAELECLTSISSQAPLELSGIRIAPTELTCVMTAGFWGEVDQACRLGD